MLASAELNRYFKELGILSSISSLVQWDNDVMMPKGSASLRQEHMMFLSGEHYQLLNNPKFDELIARAETEVLDDWQKANINNIKRQCLHNKAVDKALVEASTKASLACELNWRDARKNNDFKLFAKYFLPVLKLTQEISQRKAELLSLSPYDSLLDVYDPGRRSLEIDQIFTDLESFLPELITQAKEKQLSKKILPLNYKLPQDKQKELGLICMQALGFNFDNGRLDISAHPFSTAFGPTDSRITTRYDEDNFLSSLAGILHETGHGIYEQNLPQEFCFQPVGRNCGMTIHESQSLFVEKHIGVNRDFFTWLEPHIAHRFPKDQLYDLSTEVGASLIRVDADEVTYPAHIIMRYKLEKALLSGDLPIEDLPQAWNEESLRLFQVIPKSYQEGCLQDIHWAWGAFGYFPTYTLGAIFAAQIANHIAKTINMSKLIRKGDFKPIMQWMKENIHKHASRYSADELIIKSTGSALDIAIFKQYLTEKYL